MKNLGRIFWGVFFVLAGATVIINQLGYFEKINIFSLILAIFIIAIVIRSMRHLVFSGIFFGIASIMILFGKPLGIENLVPWPVLATALFLTIGCSVIFHKSVLNHARTYHNKFRNTNNPDNFGEVVNVDDPNEFNYEVRFGSSIKYINSKCLKRADFSCSFGALKLFFDDTKLDKGGAILNLNASFSGVEIFVPKDWRIVNNANVSLSGFEEKNRNNPTDNNTLTITGNISLSGVTIIFV